MGEHVLAEKLICGGACRVGGFHIPGIRACLPQKYVRRAENGGAFAGRKAGLRRRVWGWQILPPYQSSAAARAGLTDFAALSIGCGDVCRVGRFCCPIIRI